MLDSAADICGAVQQVILGTGTAAPSFEYLRSFIGLHLSDCFADIFPGCEPERMDELIRAYRVAYPAREHRETRLFPGVAEALAAMGGRKSTATTKGTPMARTVLEKFALALYFEHVQGTDGIPCKPAPDVIFAAMQTLQARPEECLMIGDAPADIQAARSAGVKVCAVRYGYGDPAKLEQSSPDYWIDDIRDLIAE